MTWGLRLRLSLLWFLQMAIWGSWFTYAGQYLDDLHITPAQQGYLFASMGVALWLAPLVAGQIADRWLATQWYLVISHLAGAALLLWLALAEDFWSLLLVAPLYAMAYVPTLALASSLTFRQLPDRDQQFGGVRLWGTVGWVAAGWAFGLWRTLRDSDPGGWKAWMSSVAGVEPYPADADCFRLAAFFSLALALVCMTLPHTPPIEQRRRPFPPLQVLGLLRRPSFGLLMAICLGLALVVPFYILILPKLLYSIGFPRGWITPVQTIGQITELPALLLLPLLLRRLGTRWVFALGLAAWALRFTIFATWHWYWLIIAAIALHGICHVFIFIVVQLYVDSIVGRDMRASAQNFLAVLALGVGIPIGFLLAGWVNGFYGSDYLLIFRVPATAVIVLLVVFLLGFRESRVPSPETSVLNVLSSFDSGFSTAQETGRHDN